MHTHVRRPRRTAAVRALAAIPLVAATTGCADAAASDADSQTHRTAERLLQVTTVHEETGQTLLEGPVFAPDGGLLVVDVPAPAGEPKVLRVDTATEEVSPVFTDDTGAYTSAQLSPFDDRLYLTDFAGGRILALTPEGEDADAFFSGDVEGAPMHPDDLAFDEAGNMYVSDSTGHSDPAWEQQGRVVRIDRETAEATVLADELPAPNGIAFTPDFAGLWVGQYTANRVDHYALSEDGTEVETSHTGFHFDGGTSRIDSIAVDADGNLYQAVHGQPKIFVYGPTGEHRRTVEVPGEEAAGLDSATNVAIRPGTTEAYMTASGDDGGYIYTFEALAEGIRQSNGG